MPATLPYLTSPGSLKTAFERIRSAATPDRVTRDFVSTVLQIKGGTGAAIIPFLKKIGFVASDGSPTEIYKKFRNPSTGGGAVADAIKGGYGPLSQANEYFFKLNDTELSNLVLQVTGLKRDNAVAKLITSTLKILKSYANFDAPDASAETGKQKVAGGRQSNQGDLVEDKKAKSEIGLNLSYTINLNLPATSDQAVFNAIFRSLKEHLIADVEG